MTALAKSRGVRVTKANTITLLSTAEQVYQGGIACIDTSTGLLKKAAASTTLIPIGRYAEDALVASGGTATVILNHELIGIWFNNSSSGDAIAQANVGTVVFLVDDQTVALTSNSGARSKAGMVWKVDSQLGVLVEFAYPV